MEKFKYFESIVEKDEEIVEDATSRNLMWLDEVARGKSSKSIV